MNFSVFHINCNLIFTSLYYNLFSELSNLGITQNVWIPHKKYHTPRIPKIIENVEYHFAGYQDFFDRVLFRRKINKGIKEFESFHDLLSDYFIHAHTLFSDGALAYEINRKYGNQYMVTVRATDLNLFWKYFPHLHNYGRRIVENASAVVFLNSTYKERMINHLFNENNEHNLDRVHVIPNGLDPFWRSHSPERYKSEGSEIKVLFVGNFIKRKNIKTLVRACTILKNRGEKLTLHLVGAKKAEDSAYNEINDWIEVLPFCKSKEDLAAQYRWADVFVMASFRETFGLVYAEALSQGTPVIFTKGQGFDGWIEEEVCGFSVSPNNAKEIADRIVTLKKNHCENKCLNVAKTFNWQRIAEKYVSIYRNTLSS